MIGCEEDLVIPPEEVTEAMAIFSLDGRRPGPD
jgi:hypothetical protein